MEQIKTEFDEFVKIDCKTTECIYNDANNCNLKKITIGIIIVKDYPNGIERACISYERR